jgi:hypothetical protein
MCFVGRFLYDQKLGSMTCTDVSSFQGALHGTVVQYFVDFGEAAADSRGICGVCRGGAQ